MSDDRFDEDLRAVLLEDAPREVPDELRRRVAAVPLARPPGRGWPRSWPPPMILQLAGVAAVILGVAVVALPMVIGPGVGGTTPPSASADPQTPSPSAPPLSPSPAGVGDCRADDLVATIVRWEGAAGSRIAWVELRNARPEPCRLRGTPGLRLVDAGDTVLIETAPVDPAGTPTEVLPDAVVSTHVAVSNYCGASPELPLHLVFTLPEGGSFEAQPAEGVSSEMAVPPCMGGGDSTISMNGWRR